MTWLATRPRAATAARWRAAGLCTLAACVLVVAGCRSDSTCPACPTPTPVVSGGSVSVSPTGAGIASTTTFTFTAQGFASSDGGPVTYEWDFNDGAVGPGGATVSHEFARTGEFDVRVTARNASGVTAFARVSRVPVVSLTGRWGIRDAQGRLVLGSTALTQDGRRLWGDDLHSECRFTVTGTTVPPRGLVVEYRRPAGLCQRDSLPDAFSFTGNADDSVVRFEGTLDTGGRATLVKCQSPGICS